MITVDNRQSMPILGTRPSVCISMYPPPLTGDL